MSMDKILEFFGLAKLSDLQGVAELLQEHRTRAGELEDLVKEIPSKLMQELVSRSGLPYEPRDWGALSDMIAGIRCERDAANLRNQFHEPYTRLAAEEVKLSQYLTLFLQTNPGYRFQIDPKGSATEAVIRLLDFQQFQMQEMQKKGEKQ